MVNHQENEEYIEPFSKQLGRVLSKHDFSQTELAYQSELPISYITDMKKGDRTRLTLTPVLKCIKGLIRLHEITTSDEVNEWLFSFADQTGRKYIPAEELGKQGEEILKLIEQTKADRLPEKKQSKTVSSMPLYELSLLLTDLIGRDHELNEIVTFIKGKEERLVTVTGTAGVGKTHLALKVAEKLADYFPDGYAYVPLGRISDPGEVIQTIAWNIGLQGTSAKADLVFFLRDKDLLLVVDNFEHVIDAAREVIELLAASPKLVVLVTSRVALGNRHEQVFTISPLEAPPSRVILARETAETLEKYPATHLFTKCAKSCNSNFAVTNESARRIANICRLLDGLPLAIVLAASLITTYSIEKIHDDLLKRSKAEGISVLKNTYFRDSPKRHLSLEDAIAWSYDLLKEDEKKLFRRMAVFKDGCSEEAAKQVCSIENDLLDVPTLAEKLIQYHLLISEYIDGEVRYKMLYSISEYAQQKFKDAEEKEKVRQRHLYYFLSLAEQFEEMLRGQAFSIWYRMIYRERENFQAASKWCIEKAGREEDSLRLVVGFWWFWSIEQSWTSSHGLFQKMLYRILLKSEDLGNTPTSSPGDNSSMEVRFFEYVRHPDLLLEHLGKVPVPIVTSEGAHAYAKAHFVLGLFDLISDEQWLEWRGFLNPAYSRGRNADRLSYNDYLLRSHYVWHVEAWAEDYLRNTETVWPFIEKSQRLYQELGDQKGVAFAQTLLGLREYFVTGESTLLQESLKLFEVIGYTWGQAWVQKFLADIFRDQRNYREASVLLYKSLALFKETQDLLAIAWIYHYLDEVCHMMGNEERAQEYHLACSRTLLSAFPDRSYFDNITFGGRNRKVSFFVPSIWSKT